MCYKQIKAAITNKSQEEIGLNTLTLTHTHTHTHTLLRNTENGEKDEFVLRMNTFCELHSVYEIHNTSIDLLQLCYIST